MIGSDRCARHNPAFGRELVRSEDTDDPFERQGASRKRAGLRDELASVALAAVVHLLLLAGAETALSRPHHAGDGKHGSAQSPPPLSISLSGGSGWPILHHPRNSDGPCDPKAAPEWDHFNLPAGPLRDALIEVARQDGYGVMFGLGEVANKRSRPLVGWFHPEDAFRLIAGDGGLCVWNIDDTLGAIDCRPPYSLLTRASEPYLRRDWKPPDCARPDAPLAGSTMRT